MSIFTLASFFFFFGRIFYDESLFRRSSSSCDSSSSSDRELDYEAEYESDDDDDDDEDGDFDRVGERDKDEMERPSRPPPPPPQRRHFHHHHGKVLRRREQHPQQNRGSETDTSTEVGSEDLSSAEDDSSEEEEEEKDEFSSATATECEFTDSEGRPNPFHKEIEEGRVVGPESPGASRRIYAQHLIPAPADPTKQNLRPPEAYEPTLTYSNRYQYKTPNLSDRLRSEQQTTTAKVQDFSTRRALNLKKNWVSEAAADPAAKKKASEEKDKGQIDSRLKSLMDRLSNQQKLLKPAEKPSTEMQHFLKASQGQQQQQQQQQQQPKISPSLSNGPLSPGISSPPASGSASSSFSTLYKSPPVYRSVGGESAVMSPPNASGDKVDAVAAAATATAAMTASAKGRQARPKLTSVAEEEDGEKSESSYLGGAQEEKRTKPVVIEGKEARDEVCDFEPKKLAPLALNESTSSARDEFQSCEEGDDEDHEEREGVNDAVNPSLTATTTATAADAADADSKDTPGNITNNDESGDGDFLTPGSPDAPKGAEVKAEEDRPPEEPASLPPSLEDCNDGQVGVGDDPLATSSPVDFRDIALIDEGVDDSKEGVAEEELDEEEEEEEEEKEPRAPVFSEDDVTRIYQERNPHEKIAKLNSYKEKEKSVVHELILSNRARGRSSSAARRSMRTMLPTSGAPPPPPPGEEPAKAPTHPPPPVNDLVKKKVTQLKKPQPVTSMRYRGGMTAPSRGQVFNSIGAGGVGGAKGRPMRRQTSQPAMSYSASNRPGRGEARPGPLTGMSLSLAKTPATQSNDELVSPTTSLHSNCDMDSYMDGVTTSDDSKSASSPVKTNVNNNKPASAASSSSGGQKDKRNFMKTISGIFTRSSSLSSVARTPRGLSVFDPDVNKSSAQQQQQPDTANNNNINRPKELKAQQQQQQQGGSNFRFPRLHFARSASVHRDAGAAGKKAASVAAAAAAATTPDSPPSPQGEAPRADISELGSLGSLASSVSATPKKEPKAPPFNLRASHPSTPPVPLSRKIAIGLETSASAGSISSAAVSENEENESPEDNSVASADIRKKEEELRREEREVPPEILEKIMRRGGTKAARRQARVAQVKRVRRAQEIQRQLEELDVQHKELEERGIRVEQSLRGEEREEEASSSSSRGKKGESALLQSWFQLLSEKNSMVRREQELLVQAKHLELEDRSARLESELREHLMLDSRSPEVVAREGEVLGELLSISEKREKLQAMLERDKQRYRMEDKDIQAQMAARGIRVAPLAAADD